MTALVDAYEGHRRVARLYEVELLAAVRLQAAQGINAPVVIEQPAYTRGREGPAVIQRPRLITVGKAAR